MSSKAIVVGGQYPFVNQSESHVWVQGSQENLETDTLLTALAGMRMSPMEREFRDVHITIRADRALEDTTVSYSYPGK